MLKRELENCVEEKFGQLLPYIGSFLKFLGGLLSDNNPKVTLHILECHDVLLTHVPQVNKSDSFKEKKSLNMILNLEVHEQLCPSNVYSILG